MSSLADGIRSFFVSLLDGRLFWFGGTWARVVAQNGDGSLELVPDDARLPPLSGVPVRYGVPGMRAEVPEGARVLLEFIAGDPSKPIASLWETTGATKLYLDTTGDVVVNGGTAKVARVGDNVAAAGTTIPPAGMQGWMAAVTSTINAPFLPGPGPIPAPPSTIGAIAEGADRFKA